MTFALVSESVPPNVRVPEPVTVPVNVNPLTVPVVPTEVTVPVLEDVPAPIKLLTSAAVMPVFNNGTEPLESIAGAPVSLTTPKLVLAPEAVLDPVPPLPTDKAVPDQSLLLIKRVPPKVTVPVDVIVPLLKLIHL